jgi:hypothetical protein
LITHAPREFISLSAFTASGSFIPALGIARVEDDILREPNKFSVTASAPTL